MARVMPTNRSRRSSSFFLVFAVVQAAFVRQDSLFDGHHKNDREFQSLGRMQRHYRNAVLLFIPAVERRWQA